MRVRYAVLTTFVLTCCLASVQGTRRPLDPPELIEFQPAKHFTDEYREALAKLGKVYADFDSEDWELTSQIFYATLEQERLVEAVERLQAAEDECREAIVDQNGERICDRLGAAVDAVTQLVRSGRYVNGVPLAIEVDRQKRQYLIRWREWEGTVWEGGWWGKEEVRTVSSVPTVTAWVNAEYDPDSRKYGYSVINDGSSQAILGKLIIDAIGLTRARVEALRLALTGRELGGRVELIADGDTLHIYLPGTGYLQSFNLFRFGPDRMMKLTEPGGATAYPESVRVPWKSLPGIVQCWAEVWRCHPGLDVHTDPENVTRTFARGYSVVTEIGPKSVPGFMYHGKTIGPIPVPQPDERTEFVERIRSDFQDARHWGWVADEAWGEEMQDKLVRLNAADPDREAVLQLLEDVHEAFESGRLLHESHVLLRYNLEHLADSDNWIADE